MGRTVSITVVIVVMCLAQLVSASASGVRPLNRNTHVTYRTLISPDRRYGIVFETEGRKVT
jgi:hypothetical protein